MLNASVKSISARPAAKMDWYPTLPCGRSPWLTCTMYAVIVAAGSVGFIVFAYPLFLLLNSGSLGAAIAGHAGLAAVEAVFVSASLAAGAELFATRVRSSAYSIGYNTSVAIFGGTAPYVATWLTDRTGNTLAPAYYVIVAAIVSLATVLTMRETSARPLRKLVTT